MQTKSLRESRVSSLRQIKNRRGHAGHHEIGDLGRIHSGPLQIGSCAMDTRRGLQTRAEASLPPAEEAVTLTDDIVRAGAARIEARRRSERGRVPDPVRPRKRPRPRRRRGLARQGTADSRLHVVASGVLAIIRDVSSDERVTVTTLAAVTLPASWDRRRPRRNSSLVAQGGARVLCLERERLNRCSPHIRRSSITSCGDHPHRAPDPAPPGDPGGRIVELRLQAARPLLTATLPAK